MYGNAVSLGAVVFVLSSMEYRLVGLCEERGISAAELRIVCIEYVVGKEDVSNLVCHDILHHVFGEIACVYHVNLLKGEEEISRQGITETIFEYEHPSAVVC